MNKRKFLKVSGTAAAGLMVAPMLTSCGESAAPAKSEDKKMNESSDSSSSPMTEFKQATLGYDYTALEPYIDAQTMEIHFSKHHAGYVRKLNNALKDAPDFKAADISDLLAKVGADQTGIRNNGGGHYNHTLFWECMKPGGKKAPEGKLLEAINAGFGSVEKFEEAFFKAAKTRFGSGWAWLKSDENGKLSISSTPNQDNPLMKNVVSDLGTPVLGIDVWEHAYYLKYQNLRGDYIKAFMDVVNWETVAANYAAI